ncbi:hypothetical protein HZB01_03420 [Candidatus Woesearchaeota archaeon]|nr:hypothetical protein [Candidatus Woesearchaeota archaeon]
MTLLLLVCVPSISVLPFSDHLGSTRLVTDASGNVVNNVEYLPFGLVMDGGKERFLFTGKEQEEGTSLYYYGARYYDAFLRRFTQPDKVIPNVYDPQALNRYSYALNNPLKYTDPDGKNPLLVVGALMLANYAIEYALIPAIQYTDVTIANYMETQQECATSSCSAPLEFIKNEAMGLAFGKVLGVGVEAAGSTVSKFIKPRFSSLGGKLHISDAKLQSKFKHAKEFGVTGNYNAKNAQLYKEALDNFVHGKDVKAMRGTYRNEMFGTHYYNPKTGQWAFFDEQGEYVSGWKLFPNQKEDLINNRNVR